MNMSQRYSLSSSTNYKMGSQYQIDDTKSTITKILTKPSVDFLDYSALAKSLDEKLLLKEWIHHESTKSHGFMDKLLNKASTINSRLLIRASLDGFNKHAFQDFLTNNSPLLILIKSEKNQIFGGYSSVAFPTSRPSLDSPSRSDDNAFIFSLTKKTKHSQH
jgi:hypothetical protein